MARKILVVEDEADILYFAQLRLKKAGYCILEATNTQDATKLIIEEKPDLVLLDLLLPGERGEVLCKKMKADPKLKKIPVLLFTATAHKIPEKIKETGADDGIMKPFDPKVLLKKIETLIK
jgi:DNA-binding response OmpR family regulator